MTAAVFVDTNVLVYARDGRDASRQARAGAWLAHLWRTRSGRLSTQVLSEYYTTMTRKLVPGLKREEAWRHVQTLLEWGPRPLDEHLLARAHELDRRYRLSWWDTLIVAAAQLEGCAVLLTEELPDGARFDEVVVRSPFKLAIEEAGAQYGLAASLPERHRKRGRPARVRA
jgi:predicted nucleic acid-binding protein